MSHHDTHPPDCPRCNVEMVHDAKKVGIDYIPIWKCPKCGKEIKD